MPKVLPVQRLQFLSGKSEMVTLTREKNWTQNSLGDIDQWPQSLKTTLGIILNSKFPMFLFWGKDLICFYNDAYRPSLGKDGKHPSILGMNGKEAWPEIWEIIGPQIKQVLTTGEATWNKDALVPIYRNGKIEDVYWTYSYSPVYNEENKIEGVLVTCNETTENINVNRNLEESRDEFQFAIDAAELGVWDYNPITNKFNGNARLKEWFGLPVSGEIDLTFAINAIVERDRERIIKAIEKALQFSSGGKYDEEYSIINSITKKESIVRAVGKTWFDENNIAFRFNGTLQNVTDKVLSRRKLEESEKRFRKVADCAPVLIWMSDINKQCNFVNKAWLDYTGQSADHELGTGWTAGIHADDVERCDKINIDAFTQRKSFHVEYRLKRSDGSYRWISEDGVPRFTADGIFEGYIGASMDIHEQVMLQRILKEKEEKLNIVIESSALAIWELNFKTGSVNYSDRYLEILGYEAGSVLTHPEIIKHIHPDDISVRQKAFEKAFKTGDLNFISRIIWNDKSVHWIEGRGKIFFDENHQQELMIGTVRDITEEKKYQQHLEEREQKFQLLADSMPQFAMTWDPTGKLSYFNRSCAEYTGLTYEQIELTEWTQIIHPEEKDETSDKWNLSLKNGEDFIFEHRIRRKDGKYFWHLTHIIPQRDSDENIQIWVGTSINIQDRKVIAEELTKKVEEGETQLKGAKKALIESEERYHMMIDEIQDYAIIYLDKNGFIQNWNKGAEKIKGYTADEIIGKHFSVFYTNEDKEAGTPQTLLNTAYKTGRAKQEGWRVKKDGSYFWASVLITAIHDDHNNIVGFTKVTHDVTERKQSNDLLRNNAQQLKDKNKELENMNTELQSFAYVSSHDLQEPLRKIQTFSSRIMEKESQYLSESGRDYFRRMQEAANRMQILIEDLLAYSRTNTTERIFKPVHLDEILNDVKMDMKELLLEKNATIVSEELCEVPVIRFQFRQLLVNLIGNAVKFSRPGIAPHIIIKSKIDKASNLNIIASPVDQLYCHISITDNGIGFDPQYKDKIFEVFQRLHGKDQYVGTGIGLAIVKKIVENHNGIITASGHLNKGATFDIYFPITQ